MARQVISHLENSFGTQKAQAIMTKTIDYGDGVCDFRIHIIEKK